MNDEKNILIIKKKVKKSGEEHHGGAWKVAYADFVTAMMALFIVLWVLNQNDDVKKAVSSYFNNPSGFALYGENSAFGNKKSAIPINSPGIQIKKEDQRKKFQKMKNDLKNKLSKGGGGALALFDQVEFELVSDGMRIELIDAENSFFFEIGSSRLNTNAKNILNKIGEQLSILNNMIVVEGHTDSRPFVSAGENYSNYELSADRANAARRALMRGGVIDDQIDEIRGYADKRLRDVENSNSIVNRRISIVIKYME